MRESTFEGVGGLKIFTRSWQPEGKTRGVVVIVPGFNSHSGQYVSVGEQFAAKELATYAIDLRGRGRSEGERYYVEKMEDYTDDVATLVRTAKSENPGLPVFVLGHSAGGVVSCVYALDHQSGIDGLICESFAYDLPVPGFVLTLLKGFDYIAPHLHVYTLKNENFSRDPLVVDSKNQHAAKHFHSTDHPLIKSFEPNEEWGWCYVDELLLESVPGSLTTEWCGVLGATA